MIININVSKTTFEKNLVKLGYNYKINSFVDFINSIQKKAYKEVSKKLTRESVELVFGTYEQVPVSFLVETNTIRYVSIEFFKSLIDYGELDLFLEDKNIKDFSIKIQRSAYLLYKITNLKFNKDLTNHSVLDFQYFDYEYSSFFRNKSSSQYINALRCLNLDMINLSVQEREELDNEINEKLKRAIFASRSRIEQKIENFIYLNRGNSTLNEGLIKYKLFEYIFSKVFNDNILNEEIGDIKYEMFSDIIHINYNDNKFIFCLTDLYNDINLKGN